MTTNFTARPPSFSPAIRALRIMLVVALLTGAAWFFIVSIHWPLTEDSPTMHYVIFLMKHGLQPYRTITDNNLPGAYLSEIWAMRLFGGGDVGWRIYDFVLLGGLVLAATAIAHREDWLAGFYAGSFFLLLHACDGPNYAAERDQIIAVALMIATWLLFSAVRMLRPVLLLPFGFLAGLSTFIKPTAFPIGLALFVAAVYVLRKRGVVVWRYTCWAGLGFLVAAGITIAFLAEHHAIAAFWFVAHVITPNYVALAHPGFANMLRNLMSRDFRNFVGLAGIPIFLLNRGFRHWDWERWAIALAAAFGLLSYFIQDKGFVQHRYPFEAFLLLLLGLELMQGLRTPGWPRWAAAVAIAVTIVYFVPTSVGAVRHASDDNRLADSLENDLAQLGGDRLQRQVFCFDLVYGCFNALYHLKLVENTGFTGDMMFFLPTEAPGPAAYFRVLFWKLQAEHPADVLVVTNEWFQKPNSFSKVDTWPDFVVYLQANYTLVEQRSFPTGPASPTLPPPEEADAYRIYVRNDTALLQKAKAAFASR